MPELIGDLRDALRDALERRGTLDALRAQIRREVFTAMEDSSDAQHPTPPENMVLNELVREYLEFNSARACPSLARQRLFSRPVMRPALTNALCHSPADYRHALAVFAPEAGLPPKPLPRSYVAQQAHLYEGNSELPLLYSLLAPPSPPSQTSPLPQPMHVDAAALEPPIASIEQPALRVPEREAATVESAVSRVPGPTPVIFTSRP